MVDGVNERWMLVCLVVGPNFSWSSDLLYMHAGGKRLGSVTLSSKFYGVRPRPFNLE
jgi:hypothetical protein